MKRGGHHEWGAISETQSRHESNPSMRATLLTIAVALLCSACSTGSLFDSDAPVPTSYVLAPAPATSPTVATTQADLAIGRPDFAPGLDTDRIAVLRGRQLDYYRGARWGGRTVEVVQSMLVATMQDQRLFRSVTAEQSRVSGDYTLDIEVRHFEAEYTAGSSDPAVNVALVGRLIRIVDRKLVGTVLSSARVPANDNRMAAVAAAFETASQKVALDLAQQTAAAITADEPALRTARDGQ
jgi:cholesterol transport system auxiliary component